MAGPAALGRIRKAMRIICQVRIGVGRGTHLSDEQCQRQNAGNYLETMARQNWSLRLTAEYPRTRVGRQMQRLLPTDREGSDNNGRK
jgi:hypothetical protein